MAASELLPPVQRTLPPSSCPFILEILSAATGGRGVPELARAACGFSPLGEGAGSSGG